MRFNLQFAPSTHDPLSDVVFEEFKSEIKRTDGSEVFAMSMTAPAHFSQTAVDMLAQKYARKAGVPSTVVPIAEPGIPGWLCPCKAAADATFGAETDARQIFHRLAGCWTYWGWKEGYFDSEDDARRFYADTTHALAAQRFAPNSPQWFNTGLTWAYGIGSDDRGQWAFSGGSRDVPVELVTDIDQYERPASGACLPYDERVNTTAGLIPIGEIVERFNRGEKFDVFSGDGRVVPVQAAVCNGKRTVTVLRTEDGGTIRLTGDHVVFVADESGAVVEKPASDVRVGVDRLVLSRAQLIRPGSTVHSGLMLVDTELAWAAGVMVANGFAGRPPTATADTWEVKLNTPAQRDRFVAVAASYDLPHVVKEFDWGFTVRGYGFAGRWLWDRLGLWEKTGDKLTPEWVMRSPAGCVTAYLQGLFDNDGSVYDNTIEFCNTSWDVALSVHALLRSLGVFASVTTREDPRDDYARKPCHFVRVQDRVSHERFRDLVGFTHEEKAARLRELTAPGPTDRTPRRQSSTLVVGRDRGGATQVYDIQTASGDFYASGRRVHNCFIQRIEDNLVARDGILEMMAKEARVFRNGAGSGANYSRVRGTGEPLSGGGKSSGLPSFLEPIDRNAGAIKSGGTVRRAARMVVLDLDHPDVEWFIDWKASEEKKVAALAVGSRVLKRCVEACYAAAAAGDDNRLSAAVADAKGLGVPVGTIDGTVRAARQGIPCPEIPHFDAGYEGAGYQAASGQNANNSVRVPDEFMRAVAEDKPWHLYWRTELVKAGAEGRAPTPCKTIPARALWRKICYAAWDCADPGVQFDTTVNDGNTVANDGRINGTNPCCLVGATRVFTTEGPIRIDDLAARHAVGELLPKVHAWDPVQKTFIEAVVLRAWRSGQTSDLLRVTTVGGWEIVCTPNHRFMLDDGSYVEACELRPDQLLKTKSPAIPDAVESTGTLSTTSSVGVYDLEVQGVHNFAVGDAYHGNKPPVIVHNSEYNFLDDTTCNLASVNVAAFYDGEDDKFDATGYQALCRLVTTVLDITVTMSSYPTRQIAENAAKYRTLGLGPMNVGALLMRVGVPYDSDAGRGWAAAVVGLMHLTAMRTSAEIAAALGAFPRWTANAEHTRRVNENHLRYILGEPLDVTGVQPPPCAPWLDAAREAPNLRAAAVATRKYMNKHGWKLRNAQLSLAAPTGTIGLVTDCDTTGAEPDFALTKYKKLAGGGSIKLVNKSIGPALRRLGYSALEAEKVCAHVRNTDTIEGARELRKEHLPVFDCANRCGITGKRFIAPMGHVRMLAALTPLISGSLSKTVNLPAEATYNDVEEIYREAHRLGVKCVAVYRDGSKLSQPLTSGLAFSDVGAVVPLQTAPPVLLPPEQSPQPVRVKLPNRRTGHTQKVRIGAHKLYIRTGEYEDGRLGEIFIDVDKEGSMLRGVTNTLAKILSIAIQWGVPVEELVDAMRGTKFEPNGPVGGHDRIKMCTSFVDMIARHLQIFYMRDESAAHVPAPTLPPPPTPTPATAPAGVDERAAEARLRGFKPVPCAHCGHWEMAPTAKCYTCQNCGMSDGCS